MEACHVSPGGSRGSIRDGLASKTHKQTMVVDPSDQQLNKQLQIYLFITAITDPGRRSDLGGRCGRHQVRNSMRRLRAGFTTWVLLAAGQEAVKQNIQLCEGGDGYVDVRRRLLRCRRTAREAVDDLHNMDGSRRAYYSGAW